MGKERKGDRKYLSDGFVALPFGKVTCLEFVAEVAKRSVGSEPL